MKIFAAIFDLDGTIIDSKPVWKRAYESVLISLQVKPESSYPGTFGVSTKDNWKYLISKYNIKTAKTLDELQVLTYIEYEKLIPEVYLREGAVELIMNLKNEGVEIALATSVNWEIADKVLKSLKIEYLFDNVTTGEEVLNPKPDPEIFIKVVDKMNLDPDSCLVFEDSGSGVKAAKEAGIKVIAIDPTGEATDLEEADIVIEKFSDVTSKVIDRL